MPHRLTKIATRTGDDGTTGLAGAGRVSKSAPRIQALGDIDELNSSIGVLRAEQLPEEVAAVLVELQQTLFDLGAELSMPDSQLIGERHVAAVEAAVLRFNSELPPLREFLLPGGGRTAALCQLARTVCRRAERSLVVLGEAEAVSGASRMLLNRVSDLLFVLGRVLARRAGQAEIQWRGLRRDGDSGDP
jgi:cob(I)alamin adenosyltransferase